MSKKKKLVIQKSIENRHFNRRQFLVGTGKAFLALPPLLSMMPSEVAALGYNNKKVRSVIYMGYLGIDDHQMYNNSLSLNPDSSALGLRHKPLNQIQGSISRLIGNPSNDIRSYMNVIRGLCMTGGHYQGHNWSVLGGTHSELRRDTFGKSIDTIMEKSSNVYAPGDVVPHKAVRLTSHPNTALFSYDRTSAGAPRIQNNCIYGDQNLFNSLFAGFSGGGGGSPTKDQQNQKLVVDRVYADLQTLRNNKRISKNDKNTLDRYIASVFDLQKKVEANNSGQFTCSQPSLSYEASTSGNSYQFPEQSKWGVNDAGKMFDNYIELIKLAFACDLTRVVYIGNNTWSDNPVSWASSGGLHHECASSELASDRQAWGFNKMVKLAEALKGLPDPHSSGENILDNSSILFTNELGGWTTGHSTVTMPAVLFGKGGGAFNTGNYVDFSRTSESKIINGKYHRGRPFKQLLQSIMLSMGVTKSEYSQFGDGNGFGEFIQGINQFNQNIPDIYAPFVNSHNDGLPFVSNV